MKLLPITSSVNPLLKKIRGLHKRQIREKSELFIIEGTKQIGEALAKKLAIKEILVSQSFLKAGMGQAGLLDLDAVHVVDDKDFLSLTATDHPCGIIAIACTPEWEQESIFLSPEPLIVIADRIQDPGNLGTLIRTSLAANASGLILTKGTVDPYNPKVVRSAAGALFELPVLYDMDLDDSCALVKQRQVQLIACTPDSSQPYWDIDFTRPTALIFGNEGQGVSAETLDKADSTVYIPMNAQSESLNVAVSAGIILFNAHQQRWLKSKNTSSSKN